MYTTIDLDDTLIRSQRDYDEAIEALSDWLSIRTGKPPEIITDRLNEIDRGNLEDYGVMMERFKISFEETLDEFVDDPSESDYQKAQELAEIAFKTEDEYEQRGFREGAAEMLDALNELDVTTHVLTAGDPALQKRKIAALDLDSRVDKIDIVGLHGKREILKAIQASSDATEIYHIGNSKSSDVAAALDAGVNAVYIPSAEWRNSSKEDDSLERRSDVYIFDSIGEFVASIDRVLGLTPVDQIDSPYLNS